MGRKVAIILTIVFLSGAFALTTYASYAGYGMIASGTNSSRVGSISAPRIFVGNFGSGFGGGFGGGGK